MLYQWTFHPKSQPDELLSSYLTRAAWAHGMRPSAFCHLYWPKWSIWNRDIDRSASDVLLKAITESSDVSFDRLCSMTLRSLEAVLSKSSTLKSQATWILCAGIYHRIRRKHGLQICPACLSESPHYFRRYWRLGFSVYCPTHKLPLRDACPFCDAPIIPHRTTDANLTCCHACGKTLTKPQPHDDNPLPDSAYDLQKFLTELLADSVETQGRNNNAVELFSILRSLLTIINARHRELRSILTLSPIYSADLENRGGFERDRWWMRCISMETLARWFENWPVEFQHGASRLHLTKRAFARLSTPDLLRIEVSKLPEGERRHHQKVLLIYSNYMRNLKRNHKDQYRQMRAHRLLKNTHQIQ